MVIGWRYGGIKMPFLIPSFNSRKKTIKTLTELFNRTSGSPLGQAAGTESFSWIDLRGTWTNGGNKSQSSSAANTYPLSKLPIESADMTATVKGIGNGSGVAFWITDSNNWYATVSDAAQSCQTCSTCNAYTTNVSGYYVVLNYGSYSRLYCNGNWRYDCFAYCGSFESCSVCQGGYVGPANPAYNISQCITNYTTNCSSYSYYDCNCSNNYTIKLLKNIAGTISVVTSSAASSAIAAIKAIISGTSISITSYSDSNATTSNGTLTHDAVGATRDASVGIIISPISDTKNVMVQGTSVSSITIE